VDPSEAVITEVTHVTVLVADTDEAFAPGVRWVTVAPPGGDVEFVLQEPSDGFHGAERAAAMRDQIGTGTMTVLAVDDCRATVDALSGRGVEVTTGPERVPWGIHAVVLDCYGNPYDLVERE